MEHISELRTILSHFFGWHKCRLDCLGQIIQALFVVRTINLTQVASAFLTKMERYSTLFAQQNRGKKKSSLSKAITHALYAFFRSYILKRGIFCGSEGLLISLYNANTTFYKYVKLREADPL